jgi:hypothetical protein
VTLQPPTGSPPDSPRDDLRRMAPTYIAVIVVEVVTLAALWWFQTAFGT